MKKTTRWIPGLVVVSSILLTPSLFGVKVKTYPEKADFSRYKTYEWVPPRILTKTGVREDHPAGPMLKEVVGKLLSQRGLTEVAEGADLQIQSGMLTETTPQLEAIVYSTLGADYNGDVFALGSPIATIGRYNREGSLFINLVDTKTKKSAWLAMAKDSLPTGTMSPDEARGKIEKAAGAIFKKFPAKK